MSSAGQIARILVVDDSEDSSAITATFLRRGGFERIEFARSGHEALERIQNGAAGDEDGDGFDLVVLDIVMPDMDGIEVCARLRVHEPSRHVPVLMLTASRDVETLNQAFVAGADDFVTKPVDEVRLLARVRTLLRVRREQKRRHMREEDLRLQNLNLQKGQLDAALIDPRARMARDVVVELALRTCRENGDPAALALVRIADFSLYRELHGNVEAERLADRVMAILARIPAPLAAIPCVYGTATLMVVWPNAKSDRELAEMAETMRRAVEEAQIRHGNSIRGENVCVLTQTAWVRGEDLESIGERLLGRMNARMLETQE